MIQFCLKSNGSVVLIIQTDPSKTLQYDKMMFDRSCMAGACPGVSCFLILTLTLLN